MKKSYTFIALFLCMFVSDNRIQSVYPYFQNKLNELYSDSEIRHLTNLALEKVTGLNRTELLLAKDQTVSESDLLKLRSIVKELLQKKPIEYILGETEFSGMLFKVSPAVLIPRPETEELIRLIEKEVRDPQTILDIGTGSGCIPIALKSHFTKAEVYGMDVSDKALNIARENAENLKVDVQFIQEDILQPQGAYKSFDLIVSNPPYVLESDKREMEANVLDFEPHLALFVPDEDPLLFYREILKFSEKNLKKGGSLYFEIHEKYANPIKQLFLDAGYVSVEIHQDFYGKDRIVKGIK
ncbi:MAG: peptide chain release factor N(5)-glutamine methyltransferase [Crocinitomicaceae bacterium]|nr:peptide chain release factor N(5)-glutamine methyltransferase [Crocinitomicaceae bacterium]